MFDILPLDVTRAILPTDLTFVGKLLPSSNPTYKFAELSIVKLYGYRLFGKVVRSVIVALPIPPINVSVPVISDIV